MSVHAEIEEIIQAYPVVLFMKGDRAAPQCGFSAAVVDCLDAYLEGYEVVDVLASPEVREGIKAFSEWPTIPQLFIGGEFVGGADIVSELDASGELAGLLGVEGRRAVSLDVTVTEAAEGALRRLWLQEHDADAGKVQIRLTIDRSYHNSLAFDAPGEEDLVAETEALVLAMDVPSARRAEGVVIDWVEREETAGFVIQNPAAPPAVQELTPEELKRWLDDSKPFALYDVRSEAEVSTASLPKAVRLDDAAVDRLDTLPRDTVLVFLCHHGVRSRAAGEHCLRMGFSEVFSVTGGIDAWSQQVDPSVPRY